MVSMDMMKTARRLSDEGWTSVRLPDGDNTPIPGLMLYANERHDLVRVMPDGRVIDLIEVHSAAEDFVRNGFNGDKKTGKPAFVADWEKGTRLAQALNGKKT